jgi:hypothetical protein
MLSNMLGSSFPKNHRKYTRYRVLKAGKISGSNTSGIVDVTIQDLSAGGARIQVTTSVDLAGEFNLWLAAEKMLYPVAAKWRKGELMGLEFVNEPHHVPVIDFKKLH